MSTLHSKAAEKFLRNGDMAAWHNETLWMVRAKRDKMSKEVPEWEDLREKACQLKLYSNSHLEELLIEFERPYPSVWQKTKSGTTAKPGPNILPEPTAPA